jgi:hypothetical protein
MISGTRAIPSGAASGGSRDASSRAIKPYLIKYGYVSGPIDGFYQYDRRPRKRFEWDRIAADAQSLATNIGLNACLDAAALAHRLPFVSSAAALLFLYYLDLLS